MTLVVLVRISNKKSNVLSSYILADVRGLFSNEFFVGKNKGDRCNVADHSEHV